MKVIIAGSRGIKDIALIEQTIEESKLEITEVVCGCATGVDSLGREWAEDNDIPVTEFPADWQDLSTEPVKIKDGPFGPYNVLAGFTRNQKMADYAEALIAITTGSPGTQDMIDRANKNQLAVYVKKV